MQKITCAVITLSDRSFKKERDDLSGPSIVNILQKNSNYEITDTILLPDEYDDLIKTFIYLCDVKKVNLILTTGGTGFSKRDITPEATLSVADRIIPGISEAIRAYSLKITPNAMLSRAVAAIRNQTVIINMPGNPKAITEVLEYILTPLEHGVDVLLGRADG